MTTEKAKPKKTVSKKVSAKAASAAKPKVAKAPAAKKEAPAKKAVVKAPVAKKEAPAKKAVAKVMPVAATTPVPRAVPPTVKKEAPPVTSKPVPAPPRPMPVVPKPAPVVSKPAPAAQKTVPPAPKPVEEPKATVVPPPPVAPVIETPKAPPAPQVLEIETPISVKDLATKLSVKANELIVKLMARSMFVTINQSLGEDIVTDLVKEYGKEFRAPEKKSDDLFRAHRDADDKHEAHHLVARSPVVTFMGHVDHGKTSLLDFIRKTHVADREKGGITQHIGAYEVKFKNGSVTFLDTPGHEAFTAMRARGANATDIVVLVVAADDGVMPQTKEAVDHARAANVPIVVAMNKCDLPGANTEKLKGQLMQIGLTPEDWGGKTVALPVSAKTGEGVDHLLEMLLLEAELLELKANPTLRGRGVVIEGKLSSGQGPIATLLVKNGTLRVGDMVLSGMYYGRVKAMINDKGERITEAPPSKPATILGLSGVPMAGDEFFVVKDEKKARTLSMLKQDEERAQRLKASKRVTLEDFYKKMKEGGVKELAIVVKGDVQGSVEALSKSLEEMSTKDVTVHIVHADVGNVNESDIMLAIVSNAVVIGFNVKVDDGAQVLASKEDVEIKQYGIIYEAIEDVHAAMEGLLEPVSKEVFIGRAQVKQVFKVTKAGTIAGCIVMRGKIGRNGIARLIREKKVVYEGKIGSLKRFKDDVREVNEGVECGIGLDRHDDIKVNDLIELYQIEKVARRLESPR